MSEAKSAGRLKRWLRLLGILILVVAAAVVALWLTGIPQKQLAQYLLTDALKTDVQVGSVGLLGKVTVDSLKASQPGFPDKPMLDVTNFRADYTLLAKDKRNIDSVHADTITFSNVKQAPAAAPAAPAPAEAPKAAPAKAESEETVADLIDKKAAAREREKFMQRFYPKAFDIGKLHLSQTTPTFGVEIDNVAISGTYGGKKDQRVKIEAPGITGSWWTGTPAQAVTWPAGSVNIEYEKAGGKTRIPVLKVNLPGMAEFDGRVIMDKEVDIELTAARLLNIDLSAANVADFSMPFRIGKLDLTGTRIKGKLDTGDAIKDKITMPEMALHVVGEGLSIGGAGAELYEGDLQIEGTSVAGDQLALAIDATLNRQQKIHLTVDGTPLQVKAAASLGPWSRDDIYAALPKSQRSALSFVGALQELTEARLNLGVQQLNIIITGVAKSKLSLGGVEEPAELTLDASTSAIGLLGRTLDKCKIKLAAAGGSVAWDGKLALKSGRYTGNITLENVDPLRWLEIVTGKPMAPLGATLGGTVELLASPTELKSKLNLTMAATGPAWGVRSGEQVSLAGELAGAPSNKIKGASLELHAGEKDFVGLREWEVATDSYNGKATLAGEFDLDRFVPGVQGRITVQGPLTHEKGVTTLALDSKIDGLVSPWYTAPGQIGVKAALSYDNLKGAGGADNVEITLAEGTVCRGTKWNWGGGAMELPFEFETDLRPFAAMAGDLSGTAKLTGVARRAAEGWTMQGDLTSTIAKAVLGGMATLENATVNGAFTGTSTGTGQFTLARALLAGAALTDIKGPFAMEAGLLKTNGATATFCNGAVTADIEAGLAEEGRPVRIKTQITGADLAAFTATLPVPSARLTGLADGALTATVTSAGVQALELTLESAKEFSMSVGLLAQLMEAQFVKQFKGKDKVQKAMADILGKEEMRPFDSAKLTLKYEGDRVTGTAVLKSGTLDLTLDLGMDAAAVVEFLKMAQAAQA